MARRAQMADDPPRYRLRYLKGASWLRQPLGAPPISQRRWTAAKADALVMLEREAEDALAEVRRHYKASVEAEAFQLEPVEDA